MKGMCIDSKRRVTFREQGVEHESFRNWFHATRKSVTDTKYNIMREIFRICSCCAEKRTTGNKKGNNIIQE